MVPLEILPTYDVTEVPHPDGQGLIALKTSAGKYKSLTPFGSWQLDADSAGGWERFLPFGGGWFAYREDSKRLFFISTRVPSIPYMP